MNEPQLYGAPNILCEAAFEGLLAASLVKRTRAICETGWAESILKSTWKPFAVILVVAFVSGAVLHSVFPEAVKPTDILRKP